MLGFCTPHPSRWPQLSEYPGHTSSARQLIITKISRHLRPTVPKEWIVGVNAEREWFLSKAEREFELYLSKSHPVTTTTSFMSAKSPAVSQPYSPCTGIIIPLCSESSLRL